MVISYDIFVVKVRTVIRFTLSHKFPTTWRYFKLKKVFKQNQDKQNAQKKVQHRKGRLKLPKVMNQAEKLIQKKKKKSRGTVRCSDNEECKSLHFRVLWIL